MRDAARHVATKTLGNPHPPMRWVAGYAHMEAEGGETFAKSAKAPPLQSALRGFIARYRIDHPYNPYGGMPHATASGKGGMPNRNVINARRGTHLLQCGMIIARRGTPRRY